MQISSETIVVQKNDHRGGMDTQSGLIPIHKSYRPISICFSAGLLLSTADTASTADVICSDTSDYASGKTQ
jgi:hypothetical protein